MNRMKVSEDEIEREYWIKKPKEEKDWGDIDCGCGQKDCPNCNPPEPEDDPCYMCMAGACSDCCKHCSVTIEREGKAINPKAGEWTPYGKRDIYGGL